MLNFERPAAPIYCNVCHTKWTEACLHAWGPCPFKDCTGTLAYELPPTAVATKPQPRAKRTFPLFDDGAGAR